MGTIFMILGILVCLWSALNGLNIFSFGLGLLMIVAGYYARRSRDLKVCAFCRSSIDPAATVCPKCTREQPAA